MIQQAIANQEQHPAAPFAEEQALTLLIFKVAEQSYGLPVTTVVRIIEMVTITHLPNAPAIIRGIINLHGRAVPIMDLRQRFGLPVEPYGLHTPIILVDIGNDQIMGLVVDWVEQVQTVPAEDLEIVDVMIPIELLEQMTINAGHLAGVAKANRQLILILEAPALLKAAEQVDLSRALAGKNYEPPTSPPHQN